MLILAITFLSGCVTGKNGVAFDPVGPSPNQPTADNATNGTLMVYSAYEVNADFGARDPNSPEYSDYKILTTDDRLLQKVHNNDGTILQGPVSVELPSGKYRVVAHSNGYGYVTIPVIIGTGQTTILHLEGDGFWPNESAFNQTNAVRLPDGVVIGWKAAANL
jgi:hypothetical protein